MKEMIIASAVKLSNNQFYVGKRHTDAQKNALAIMGEENFYKEKVIDTGYITTTLRFLNRDEAYFFAVNNGQIKLDRKGYDGEELFSEDLW
jgi:hypothetical protein